MQPPLLPTLPPHCEPTNAFLVGISLYFHVYYVTADLTLVLQYVWYTHWRQCRKESQQAYEVITGDDNCSTDDPAGQEFQDTSLIENGYEDSQAVKKRFGGGA
jgi:hypothetical protein